MGQTAEFREFRYDDLFFMNLRDFERQLFDGIQDCVLQIIAKAKNGPAETCIYKGKILFFYTIQEYNGMATLSLVASEEADNHPIPFARASSAKVEELTHKYRRLQATVHVDYEKSIRWLVGMRFEIEGTLRKYDHNGDDYYMMARTK